MPSMGLIAGFVVASLVLILVPGPNAIYIVTRSATQGWRAGVVSALGVETGTLFHLGLAAVGVSSLLAASPVAFTLVRYAGAAYLVWLAIRSVRRPAEASTDEPMPKQPMWRLYADGALVNVLNPKVALFFLAFLPQFVRPDAPAAPQLATYATVFMLLGLLLDLGYAGLGGTARRWLTGGAGSAWPSRMVAMIYLGLAGYAVFA